MKRLSFTVDRNLRIRSWNDELGKFTGADAFHAVGKKYTDLFPRFLADDREAVSEAFKRRRSINLTQCSFRCLYRHQRADIEITPVRNADDSVRRMNVELAPTAPCPSELQGEDVRKLLEIGKIAATLAHGVRGPLNAIKGAVVYLGDHYAQEPHLLEFTEILSSEISRLERFIAGFLDAKAPGDEAELVDVNEVIGKLRVYISLQLDARRISCEVLPEQVPPVRISAFYLEQALLNVVNNALEAIGTGGKLVIRTFLIGDAPAPRVALEVSDTGAGIVPAAPRSARDRAGRGYGLLIAEDIVKRYHGRLKIAGEKGRGTKVTFLLPPAGKDGHQP